MFASTRFQTDPGLEAAQLVLSMARALFVPDSVVHLGAGTGQGPLHQWRQWPVKQSLLVDSQANRMAWAKEWAEQSPSHYVKVATLGVEKTKTSFQIASNQNESGLVDIEKLTGLWPNLKRVETLELDSIGLDRLLEETDSGVFLLSSKIWLLVDFFCSAEFWSVASATLSKSSVLVIRQSQISLEGVESIAACDKRLAALGFIRAADLESNHPQVIHGVYLRNLSTEVQQALSLSNQEAKAKNELALKLEEESKVRAALAQEKAALLEEKATLVQDKAALEKEKAALLEEKKVLAQDKAGLIQEATVLKAAKESEAKAKEQALAQRDQEAKAKNDLALRLDQESKACATLAQEKTVLVQEKTVLVQDMAKLSQDKGTLEKEKARLIQEAAEFEQQKAKLTKETMALKVSLETQAKEFSATQLRCQELESINQNLENRQQLLHEELVKAEAQIELIKDLLLRESGI